MRRIVMAMSPGAQMLSASPYLDSRAWHYDVRHVSPALRFRAFSEQPLRFASAAHPARARFRVQPPELGPPAPGRMPKSLVMCHFHPNQPFVLCVLQTFGQLPRLCVHLRP